MPTYLNSNSFERGVIHSPHMLVHAGNERFPEQAGRRIIKHPGALVFVRGDDHQRVHVTNRSRLWRLMQPGERRECANESKDDSDGNPDRDLLHLQY